MLVKKVLRLINEGGFGKIEEVVCDDGQHYARKTFSPSPQFLPNKDLCAKLKQRFIREVRTQKDYHIHYLFQFYLKTWKQKLLGF